VNASQRATLIVFGRKAKKLAEDLGVTPDNLPDALTPDELILLQEVEDTAIAVLKKVRYAQCPMPYALCPIPNALFGQCPVWPMPCLANAPSYIIFRRKAICRLSSINQQTQSIP
jgi:hypothetical protein